MRHSSLPLWLKAAFVVALSLTQWSGQAAAQVVNGDFETGSFTGWSVVTSSTSSVTTTPAAPFAAYSNGTNQAVLTAGTSTPAIIASQLTSGNSLGYTVTVADLNAVTSPSVVGDGSVIFQQFTGGGTFTFRYGWNNAEGVFESAFNDTMFVYLDGLFTVLRNTNNASDSAYQTFTQLNLPAGSHFLAVGAFNGGDGNIDSQGIFDNFSIAAVPEPTTWALIGVVTLGAGAYSWNKRRKANKSSFARLK